jgi:hypothetical protein
LAYPYGHFFSRWVYFNSFLILLDDSQMTFSSSKTASFNPFGMISNLSSVFLIISFTILKNHFHYLNK